MTVRLDLVEPEHAPDDVRRLADDVLADAVFDRPAPSLLARARDWFLARLEDAIEAVVGSGGSALGWVIVALLLVAGVLVAVRVARAVQRDPGARTGTTGETGRPVTDWLAEAAALEARGEWRAALRCRYRALVAGLAARGLVDEVPGRTAGEYRSEVARTVPAVAADFDGATALFEGAWYGRRPVGAEDARRLEALSREVLTTAGGPR